MSFRMQHLVVCSALCSTPDEPVTSVYVATPWACLAEFWLYEHWLFYGISFREWPETTSSQRSRYSRAFPFHVPFLAMVSNHLYDSFGAQEFYEIIVYASCWTWMLLDAFIRRPDLGDDFGEWRRYQQHGDVSVW